MKIKNLFYCSTIIIFLTGCEALNNYDRSASGFVDVSEKKVGIIYKIWGAKEPGKGTLSGDFQVIGSLDGKAVISLE